MENSEDEIFRKNETHIMINVFPKIAPL